LVHAAAAAFDSWVRSVALAVGSLRQKRRADPPDDLSIGGGGAAAFRSQVHEQPQAFITIQVWLPLAHSIVHCSWIVQTHSRLSRTHRKVLLAYPIRRELQREAAAVLWRLHSQPSCEQLQAATPAADAIYMQRLAMVHGSSEPTAQARQPAATMQELKADVAAMARLLDAFDMADEKRSYWWDGTHALALLQRHFGFVLRAGQRLSVAGGALSTAQSASAGV
jgi:hypothetical protein